MKKIEEKMILMGLINLEKYFTTTFPFIEESFFEQKYSKVIFKIIKKYNLKYNKQPNISVIEVMSEKLNGISEDLYTEITNFINETKSTNNLNENWLIDETESWIKNRKYFNAIFKAAEEFEKGEIDTDVTKSIEDALSFCFDSSVGMDFRDAESRWEFYVSEDEKIPFDINFLNVATNGGVSRKTLNILMSANSGGGKSLSMCHFATQYIKAGYNVVYFTMEMSEDKIFERIDANLLDVPIQDIKKLGKENFISRIEKIKSKINGNLIVKQFPTAAAHVGHFRYFLKELKLKKGIIPDVLIFDYLNITASQRSKEGNSYTIIKSVAEELRGLVVEYNCIGWTGTQSNRDGIKAANELSTAEISDSIGTLYTCDLLIGLINTPEFDEDNKILMKVLKNRYGDISKNNSCFVGIKREFMRLENTEEIPGTELEKEETETVDFSLKRKHKLQFGDFN